MICLSKIACHTVNAGRRVVGGAASIQSGGGGAVNTGGRVVGAWRPVSLTQIVVVTLSTQVIVVVIQVVMVVLLTCVLMQGV